VTERHTFEKDPAGEESQESNKTAAIPQRILPGIREGTAGQGNL